MKPYLGSIGPIRLSTYTLLLDLAILAGLTILAWRGKRLDNRPNAWLDAGLAALVGGVIGGRLGHVGIHWAYFYEHPSEIYQVWLGGLDWHGAVVLGLAGLFLTARLRGLTVRALLDALAFALPLGAALTFGGCLLARCAYGREVASLADYPAWLAAELPDLYGVSAPRLLSQGYGIVLGVVLLLVTWGLSRLFRREGVIFWLALTLLGLGAFGIGMTLGDSQPMVGPLRLDQVLDLAIAGLSLIAALITGIHRRPEPVNLIAATPLGEL
jgi:phosphatidylglycerol:prolipoprotein diacylglycerol transferase